MARFNPIFVWLYVIVGTLIEVFSVYKLRPYSVAGTDAIILVLGASEVAMIGAYFMHLKFEQKSLLIIAVIPLLITAALITGVLVSVVR
jgi:cytochrome c oxidase subunit IV